MTLLLDTKLPVHLQGKIMPRIVGVHKLIFATLLLSRHVDGQRTIKFVSLLIG